MCRAQGGNTLERDASERRRAESISKDSAKKGIMSSSKATNNSATLRSCGLPFLRQHGVADLRHDNCPHLPRYGTTKKRRERKVAQCIVSIGRKSPGTLTKEVIALKRLIREITLDLDHLWTVWCDSQQAIGPVVGKNVSTQCGQVRNTLRVCSKSTRPTEPSGAGVWRSTQFLQKDGQRRLTSSNERSTEHFLVFKLELRLSW